MMMTMIMMMIMTTTTTMLMVVMMKMTTMTMYRRTSGAAGRYRLWNGRPYICRRHNSYRRHRVSPQAPPEGSDVTDTCRPQTCRRQLVNSSTTAARLADHIVDDVVGTTTKRPLLLLRRRRQRRRSGTEREVERARTSASTPVGQRWTDSPVQFTGSGRARHRVSTVSTG